MHSLPDTITAYVVLATEPKIIIMCEHLHVSMQPIRVSECSHSRTGRTVFSIFQPFECDSGFKITQKGPCDITGSLMCTLSPRSPLDEDDVHKSFNQIIAENSVAVAPSEAFELQELQWELTEEGEGILGPSSSLKCHSELERCSW